jgi:hypothetical protein
MDDRLTCSRYKPSLTCGPVGESVPPLHLAGVPIRSAASSSTFPHRSSGGSGTACANLEDKAHCNAAEQGIPDSDVVVYVSAKEASLCVPHGSSVAPTASVAFAGE